MYSIPGEEELVVFSADTTRALLISIGGRVAMDGDPMVEIVRRINDELEKGEYSHLGYKYPAEGDCQLWTVAQREALEPLDTLAYQNDLPGGLTCRDAKLNIGALLLKHVEVCPKYVSQFQASAEWSEAFATGFKTELGKSYSSFPIVTPATEHWNGVGTAAAEQFATFEESDFGLKYTYGNEANLVYQKPVGQEVLSVEASEAYAAVLAEKGVDVWPLRVQAGMDDAAASYTFDNKGTSTNRNINADISMARAIIASKNLYSIDVMQDFDVDFSIIPVTGPSTYQATEAQGRSTEGEYRDFLVMSKLEVAKTMDLIDQFINGKPSENQPLQIDLSSTAAWIREKNTVSDFLLRNGKTATDLTPAVRAFVSR